MYATCVAGVIGDDIKAVCKKAQKVTGCRVIPVQSEGFQHHNKTKGHWIGGDALLDYVIGTKEPEETTPFDINVVGEFNVAGDFWGIKPLLEEMGVNIISTITGDSHVEEIAQAHRAKLNIVQCQKSSNYIAQKMEKKYGIPSIKVNFFGLEQTVNSLREIADFFGDEEMIERTEKIIEKGLEGVQDEIHEYKERLTGKTVALYVGGNKAWSLVRAFEELGMDVMMSGTKNGIREDYERIKEVVRDGTIIVDDANSAELARLLKKHHPDLLISGAKEKYISLKLGIPFCDFNHDRISAFAGFKGFISFAKEVDASVSSPVFDLTKTRLTNTPSPEIFTSHKKSLTPLNTGGDDHAS